MNRVILKPIVGLVCLLTILLVVCSNGQSVYITIENIGGRPITSANLNVDVEPFQSDYDFQLRSARSGWDPSNIYFQFDEANPIGVGETYISPLIPEITDVDFNVEGIGVSGWNVFMGGGTPSLSPVIPDVSSITRFNPDINFGYTISFYSGGESIPPPEPRILLIDNSTLGYYNVALGTALDGTQPQFPASGDPVIFPAEEPDLTYVSSILGDWLSPDPFPLNENWSDLLHVGSQAPYTEKAILYAVEAGLGGIVNVKGNFGVDNGIFVWVNGEFKFGAVEPGQDLAFEYANIDLGNLPPGLNFIQILLEDHGGSTGYKIQITGQLPPEILPIDIDIKPGSDDNCINNNGHGIIPVAILGSADFDTNQVDPSICSLAGQAVKAVGKADKLLAHIDDVNGDGFDDLVLQIEDVDGTFEEGNGEATLNCSLYDGTPIEGSDTICIVP